MQASTEGARGSTGVRAGTAAAALAAVVAVSIYLQLPGSLVSAEAGNVPAAMPLPPEAGFLADVGYLPDDGMLGFVEIPAGPFLMGSDPAADRLAFDNERWSADRVQGVVDLPTYYIARFEVTGAQFRDFVEATGHRASDQALLSPPTHPVAFVSWPDALAYARWLDATLRDSQATPPALRERLREGWRVTLPTEAQWEKAARGTDGRIFPWGDEPRRDHANFAARGTAPVGSFACADCPYGLSDMSGNVWEWTRSPFQPYPFDATHDRTDLTAEALWVMRGGAFSDAAQNVRSAIRGGADPGVRRPFIGFRLVVTPPEH